MSPRLLVLLGACCIAVGCGGGTRAKAPSIPARRAVAVQFAEAIVHGDTEVAAGLLLHPDGLTSSVSRAAAPWRVHHGTVQLPGKRTGSRWIFRYAGVHPHADGRFEEVRGDLVVVVEATHERAGVEAFAFQHTATRFRTHHDSQLLPSAR